jgi:hypothetical protein
VEQDVERPLWTPAWKHLCVDALKRASRDSQSAQPFRAQRDVAREGVIDDFDDPGAIAGSRPPSGR